jgi:hypothetical protein
VRRQEVTIVSVNARTVKVRDVIVIGGRPRRVESMRAVHGGTQLHLHTGELLVIGLREDYTVSRPEQAASWKERR